MANALDLLDEQVDGLGGSVGAAIGDMPGQDLGLPGSHGAGQPGQLSDLDAFRPADEAVQRGPGRRRAGRGVDGPQQLLALPGRGQLASRISGGEAGP
jgi:hypothetical protein